MAPQELPGQPVALCIAIAAAFFTSMAGLLFAYGVGEALVRSALALAVPGLLLFGLLKVRGMQNRYAQSFGAICGAASVVYLLALPFMPYFFNAVADDQANKTVVVFILLLDIWSLLISAHILKHTLDIEFVTAISLSFLIMIITILVIEYLLPAVPSPELLSQLGQQSQVLLSCAAYDGFATQINQLI